MIKLLKRLISDTDGVISLKRMAMVLISQSTSVNLWAYDLLPGWMESVFQSVMQVKQSNWSRKLAKNINKPARKKRLRSGKTLF